MAEEESLGSKIVGFLFGVGMIVLSVFCFMYPNALEGARAGGRRGLIKLLLIWLWGWPLGVISGLFGILVVVGTFIGDTDSDDE